MKTSLTVQQALAEGFTKWGYANREWQHANDITDINSADFDTHEKILLFSKESKTPSIEGDYIRDMIADSLNDDWSSETNDDTNEVMHTITAMNFDDVADRINEKLSKHVCYTLTDIELIP